MCIRGKERQLMLVFFDKRPLRAGCEPEYREEKGCISPAGRYLGRFLLSLCSTHIHAHLAHFFSVVGRRDHRNFFCFFGPPKTRLSSLFVQYSLERER